MDILLAWGTLSTPVPWQTQRKDLPEPAPASQFPVPSTTASAAFEDMYQLLNLNICEFIY